MIPSDKELEEPSFEPTQANIEKDFKVFYRVDTEESPEPSRRPRVTAQVNTSQEVTDIPEGMVLEEKTPNLFCAAHCPYWGKCPRSAGCSLATYSCSTSSLYFGNG